jgi:lipopolysaccharide exporter
VAALAAVRHMKRNAEHSVRAGTPPGQRVRDDRAPADERVGGLVRDVRRGIAWSGLSNLVLRVSSLAVGIVLARLLSPEEFGIYAVALTVQAILMTVADLGLSADLIRSQDPERKAPTVATLGVVVGTLLTVLMVATCQPLAESLGSPDAASTIAVLATTLLLGGAGVVPYAMLQRRFAQKQLFAISLADFSVGTSVTIGLVLLGWGVIGLAIGRVVAQCLTLVLQFVFARVRPRFGFDRSLVRQVLAFGLPIAGANLISWALLNVDNVVISRIAGPTALGFYVLAFNISSWPMSAIGQVVRSISLPLFARSVGRNKHTVLADTVALTWAAALPAGAFLALLSAPTIVVVYGPKWLPAAQVLAALGLFGALRALFDVFASYLLARGASRSVLWTQVIWVAALVPTMIAATGWLGIVGAGWVHLAVAVVFVLPAYLIALRRAGIELAGLARACWPPVAAMIPAAAVALLVSAQSGAALWRFLLGGLSGSAVYLALIYQWASKRIRAANSVHKEEQS